MISHDLILSCDHDGGFAATTLVSASWLGCLAFPQKASRQIWSPRSSSRTTRGWRTSRRVPEDPQDDWTCEIAGFERDQHFVFWFWRERACTALPERRRPCLLIPGDHGRFDLDAPALLGIFSADDDCPVDTEKQLGRSHELNLQRVGAVGPRYLKSRASSGVSRPGSIRYARAPSVRAVTTSTSSVSTKESPTPQSAA